MNIIQTLENSMPLLTGKQKQIAGFMLKNPNEMCFITLKDFSHQVGCTEATAIRFCQKIGFESFSDAKNSFREVLAQNSFETRSVMNKRLYAMTHEAIENEDFVKKQIDLEKTYFNNLLENLDLEKADAMVDEILAAHAVYIVGRGTSFAIAEFMRRRLALFGVRAFIVNPEDTTALQSAVNGISNTDLFIFLTFPMYYLPILNIARYVKEHGAKVIGYTDSADSLLIKHCDHYLLTGEMEKGHYYSYASFMMFFSIMLTILQVKTKDSSITDFKNVLEEISHPDYQGSDYQAVTPVAEHH